MISCGIRRRHTAIDTLVRNDEILIDGFNRAAEYDSSSSRGKSQISKGQ